MLGVVLTALLVAIPAVVSAAPGDSATYTGSVEISVVQPVNIQRVADLRFGRIIQPSSDGTLTIGWNGSVSSSGSLDTDMTTPQVINGRGPAAFVLFGDPNRRFHVFIPKKITISNGTSTMVVDKIEKNAGPPGWSYLNATGFYPLFVGGTLNVTASQQVGSYSGTFDITVKYN